ncbi:MAG: flavodoxin-dependent (E)-4-hydroxy-3-methylbut-2-enyl-diphosphate synthase [Aeromonadales bacterium]|nr:flavodoxin-dependent (E)-4-hydroxy-3-methylbut-2-enyl-diphosphate synthase [Aeromonadales bacterium]MDY2891543.1 flavodoxin-dependent (E)-4-hydroxy-3-methylbut-2-enyl-diphosphate synthase [Succinivibrio sp.]
MQEWKYSLPRRRKSRQIDVGGVKIGGLAPVSVQSMTSTDTMDVEGTLSQVRALADAGADIVRVSVPTLEACDPFSRICKASTVPIVADIHFDYRIAVKCASEGAAALRINPGNIGSRERIEAVCRAAEDHGLPIRVGVNAGSLDKDLLKKYGAPCPQAMAEAALRAADVLESHGFRNYAFSAKASEIMLCVGAYELLASKTDAPLHLGITEAGGLMSGTVLSAMGISWLLREGIGDTIRVSLAADPVEEVRAGWAILKGMHLRSRGVEIVACPTCSRHAIDVVGVVKALESRLSDVRQELKIAVMGCVVNGPGEALRADIAVCGGGGGRCLVYEDGVLQGRVEAAQAADALESRVRARIARGGATGGNTIKSEKEV